MITGSAVFAVPPATLRTLANATVAPIAEEARRHTRTEFDRGGGAPADAPTGA
jgi:hypothetical protein